MWECVKDEGHVSIEGGGNGRGRGERVALSQAGPRRTDRTGPSGAVESAWTANFVGEARARSIFLRTDDNPERGWRSAKAQP